MKLTKRRYSCVFTLLLFSICFLYSPVAAQTGTGTTNKGLCQSLLSACLMKPEITDLMQQIADCWNSNPGVPPGTPQADDPFPPPDQWPSDFIVCDSCFKSCGQYEPAIPEEPLPFEPEETIAPRNNWPFGRIRLCYANPQWSLNGNCVRNMNPGGDPEYGVCATLRHELLHFLQFCRGVKKQGDLCVDPSYDWPSDEFYECWRSKNMCLIKEQRAYCSGNNFAACCTDGDDYCEPTDVPACCHQVCHSCKGRFDGGIAECLAYCENFHWDPADPSEPPIPVDNGPCNEMECVRGDGTLIDIDRNQSCPHYCTECLAAGGQCNLIDSGL